MRRSLPYHLLLSIVGFALAILIGSIVYLATLSLPYFLDATQGWALTFIKDAPLHAMATLFVITAITAFPGWIATAIVGELGQIRSKYFYATASITSVFLAHFFFNGMNMVSIDPLFLIPALISGLCGGFTYWAFIGRQAGAWLPPSGDVK